MCSLQRDRGQGCDIPANMSAFVRYCTKITTCGLERKLCFLSVHKNTAWCPAPYFVCFGFLKIWDFLIYFYFFYPHSELAIRWYTDPGPKTLLPVAITLYTSYVGFFYDFVHFLLLYFEYKIVTTADHIFGFFFNYVLEDEMHFFGCIHCVHSTL